MTDDAKERRALATCWGIFDINGNWRPNPHLQITGAEQRRQNIEAGFMTPEGKRIPPPAPASW